MSLAAEEDSPQGAPVRYVYTELLSSKSEAPDIYIVHSDTGGEFIGEFTGHHLCTLLREQHLWLTTTPGLANLRYLTFVRPAPTFNFGSRILFASRCHLLLGSEFVAMAFKRVWDQIQDPIRMWNMFMRVPPPLNAISFVANLGAFSDPADSFHIKPKAHPHTLKSTRTSPTSESGCQRPMAPNLLFTDPDSL